VNTSLYVSLGRVAGLLGLLLCAIAAVTRITGNFHLGPISADSLLSAGTAGMVAGCFLLLLAHTKSH
jgi:hypothetical protein